MMDELVFTPSAVMGLLSSIEELADLDIDFYELGNSIIFTVGDSQYEVRKSDAEEVEVPSQVVEEVAEINDAGYEDLDMGGAATVSTVEGDPIEGGLIKEILKTVALGGLVRLTKHALEKA